MEPGLGDEANTSPNFSANVDPNANANANVNANVNVEVVEAADLAPAAPPPPPPEAFDQPFNAQESAALSASLIHTYFTTQFNPLTRHHIDSYDQFLQRDLKSIIASHNPLIILKNPKSRLGAQDFKYKAEIYIGGQAGNDITLSTPTVILDQGRDVRLLFPNEARLRALTYSTQISANVLVRVTILQDPSDDDPHPDPHIEDITIENMPLFNLPLMLHSSSCLLHGKPAAMLTQMGECPQDQGGYFIVDGSEKVLVTRQEGAFNTLWINRQNDPLIEMYSSISSLNPKTREVKRVSFYWTREITRKSKRKGGGVILKESILEVSIPFVLKPIPIFVLFRALGIQSDKDILQMIFPDMSSPETKYLADLLIPSINAAAPFLDTYSAIQYIKTLTKGFSVVHVLDIVHNQLFPHVDDLPNARAVFLADCVHKILRVAKNLDEPASRDDTRNQRLLTAGFLIQMMFGYNYKEYTKAVIRRADETFAYNESIYSGNDFSKIFKDANQRNTFHYGFLSERIQRAFKGKWAIGSGKEQVGALQELSRLSYLDFTSHLRRAVLNFDTSMKLQGPRRLHPSQYGYFCTSETPSGGHIGVAKNLSIMTAISTGSYSETFRNWLYDRGRVVACEFITPELAAVMVPVYLNNGTIGFVSNKTAPMLARVLRLMKRSGCLPPLSSSGFNIPQRRVFIYLDDGRPLRPLIICEPRGHLPNPARFKGHRTWRDLIVGTLVEKVQISSREFIDPLNDRAAASLTDYITFYEQNADKLSLIEYIDPYEQNETLIANFPEHVLKETTHMEVHPSTILGLLGNCIPYPNHNQSPRNQLSASQSKQGLSMYATNWNNRFDNTANVLCYGQAPLGRTMYQDYFGEGQMSYGQNIILAMGMYGGYNQEDGIIMNADALARGQFRSLNYRSYSAFEEDDRMTQTQIRIGNPKMIPAWLDLNTRLDYTKLDEQGIVKVGEYVDQNTVLVGRYQIIDRTRLKDASVTPQVWTYGRVEKVVVMVNNMGLRLVKIRIVQDRVPQLGDKFCLTPDHDVLTRNRGWVSIADVTTEDRVAQLNREKGTLEYVQPNETFVFEHTGDMYDVKTQGVNLCTTLNHRMWVQPRSTKKTEYTLIEAKDMMGKRMKFSSLSPTSTATPHTIQIGSTPFTVDEMDSFITLFGIWIAEGWTYICERDSIARLEFSAQKPAVQEILKNVCQELNLKSSFNAKSGKFYINSKDYATYFNTYSVGATNKRLPDWCFDLSKAQSALLIAALCVGDGHETMTSLHYGTSSIGLRDDIQTIVQHAGYTSTYTKLMEAGQVNVGKDGTQYKASTDHWGIYIRRKRLHPTLNHGHAKTQGGQTEQIIQYSGRVYCISVPSEVFLVRREGTIVWTGNSNRHGQKGTMNVMYRSTDMPRTAEGITPDMIMNPTAIPSRMTIGQIFEMMFGVVSAELGAIGNVTAFMNDGSPHELLGNLLEKMGLNRMCNQVLYNGMTGEQMTADIYMGVVYGMRLKHMTEDKWNARGVGRKEARTHQPTGGRGNEGGMKLGEMERDAILGHGISAFQHEAYMTKSDGTTFIVCNGCGTIPFYNEKQQFYICPLCDGPIQYSGDSVNTLEPIPPPVRSVVTFSKIQMPYATKLFFQELNTFLNMGLRVLTTRDTTRLSGLDKIEELAEIDTEGTAQVLKPLVYQTIKVPERVNQPVRTTAAEIQRNIMMLQEEARSAYQVETASVAASAPAGSAPTAAQVMAAPANGVQMSVSTASTGGGGAPDAGAGAAGGGGAAGEELAPGSMAPAPLGVAGVGANVVATTAEGQPVVDLRAETTAEALTNAGLRMPNDATRPIQAQAPPSAGFGMGQPNMGRRSRSRSPNNQRNQGNQGNQGRQGTSEFVPNEFQGNAGNGWGNNEVNLGNPNNGGFGNGGEDEPSASAMQPTNPIKVIKEG